ncbi:MAG: hypothetical protein ABIR24_04045, partial [Verrucomicrobiota bacterium]
IFLGSLVALINLFGVLKPAEFGVAVRKFPRSTGIGYLLVLLGTSWFVWNLKQESISDFESLKPWLFGLFIAVGVGTCIFVKDFIAVRGLAIVLLLMAKTMVDAGRPRLGDTPWVLVIQIWAYVFVVLGIWFTISPWRMRDFLNWGTANEKRIRVGSAVRMALGLFVASLGLTVF